MPVYCSRRLIAVCLFAITSCGFFDDSVVLADLHVADDSDHHAIEHTAGSFTYLGTPTKWEPGENTASVHGFVAPAGPGTPGGATWSVMLDGAPDSVFDPHPLSATGNVYAGGILQGVGAGNELAIYAAALNVWASVSGFENLGMKPGSVAEIGSPDPVIGVNSHDFGDIRIGAFEFPLGSSTLAHAYQPGTDAIFAPGGSLAGDVHFDVGRTWVDVDAEIADASPDTSGFDLFSVALHEFGHALGLGHSSNPDSIMFPSIAINTSNRVLHADDIAGIQALYGLAAVPEPSSFLYFGVLACGVVLRKRQR